MSSHRRRKARRYSAVAPAGADLSSSLGSAPADLSRDDIKAILRDHHIRFDGRASREELALLLPEGV